MDLLVVDDSPDLLDLLDRALRRDGHDVRLAASLAEAREAIARRVPDVVVLDVALPDGTGVEFCRALRAEGRRMPVLLLTAHGEVAQRVAGLDAGADDFMAKPFAVAELRARIRALARRGPLERSTSIDLAGGVTIDPGARRATRDGVEVPVTAREWDILMLLVARRGRVVARATILELVWGEVTDGASASLDVLLARLRRKLGPVAIRTIRGEGYAADVA